jgi:hypothetical protein
VEAAIEKNPLLRRSHLSIAYRHLHRPLLSPSLPTLFSPHRTIQMRIYITFVVAAFSSFSFVNAAPAALSWYVSLLSSSSLSSSLLLLTLPPPCSGSGLFLTPSSTCSATCPPTYFGDVKSASFLSSRFDHVLIWASTTTTAGTCKRCYSHSVLECTSAKSTAATKCQARYYLNRGRCVPQALVRLFVFPPQPWPLRC